MKTALLLVTLLMLGACGNKNVSGNNKNHNEYRDCTAALDCLPPPSPWTVTSSSTNFPKHFSLRMIGKQMMFEARNCPMNDLFKLSQTRDGKTNIKFGFHVIPQETFKVEIIDLGENCDNNAIFHSEDNVSYGVIEITTGRLKEKSVSVYLNN